MPKVEIPPEIQARVADGYLIAMTFSRELKRKLMQEANQLSDLEETVSEKHRSGLSLEDLRALNATRSLIQSVKILTIVITTRVPPLSSLEVLQVEGQVNLAILILNNFNERNGVFSEGERRSLLAMAEGMKIWIAPLSEKMGSSGLPARSPEALVTVNMYSC